MDPIIVASAGSATLASFGYLYRRNKELEAQVSTTVHDEHVEDVKDELIDTLQANHAALQDRVEILESKARGLDEKLTEADGRAEMLSAKLADSLDRYEELSKYAAPEAIKQFTGMFDTFAHATDALLQGMLERMKEQEELIAAIHANTVALRDQVIVDREMIETLKR